MNMRISTAPIFFLVLLGCFCLDIYSYLLLGYQPIMSLLALFTIAIAHKQPRWRIVALLLALSIESFFFIGYAGLNLMYLIPLLIVASKLRHAFWEPLICSLLALGVALFSQQVILEYYLLDIYTTSSFTILKIGINIILVILLSMIY